VAVEFCDLPQVSGASGRFLLTSMAAVAELEAGLISERTKAALAAAKANGKRLGAQPGASPLTGYLREHGNVAGVAGKIRAANERAESYRGILAAMIADGLGNSAIADAMNERGEASVGGGQWTATAVRRIRARLGLDSTVTKAAA
jgi:DNA invertase Pin-like site-specific DNA recombinase